MENLENAYIKSLLSKVAYEKGIDVGYNFNFLGAEFSNAEREYLNENYEVIGTKHTESGLDLVIFKNLVTGENTISIAGTDIHSAADWGNDLSLGATGIAHKQFIELYNYYQQITHAYGENILQITKLENPSYEPEKPYLRIETAEDEYTYYLLESVENNELPIDEFVAIDANNLSFTGHSLGGHLAGIMSIITGKEATIFNAPSYKENTILSSGCEYVKTDGSIEETTSDFDALICKLLNISNPDSKEGNITHYQNNYGGGFSENIAGSWNSTEEIYCLNGNTNWVNEHSINEIHSTLYAYYVIKDIATEAESFFNNSNLTSPNETFENIYKAYCLNKGEAYQELNYSEYTNINQIISKINEWSETQKTNGGAIKVDSFNHSTSLPITGTDGADIFYTGGGNDTIDAGAGNDTVYGIDLNGDTEAAASSTKTINLGIGDDKYYGSNGKDIIDCGLGSDHVEAGAGENFIDLGTDNDKDTVIINNNTSGVDTIVNITKYDHIFCVGGFNLSSLQQVGNDIIIYGNNGNKIIFKDVAETKSMPILEQENNTLLYWKNGVYTEIEANPYAFESPSEEQICALLSKLAYENLSTGFNFNNLDKTKYTVAEIAYLKENFSVNETKCNSVSGFYGYIIENTKTGNLYCSIRGTDSLFGNPGAEDWGISTNGIAMKKFIEAYNFYIEETTPSGVTGYKIVMANEKPETIDNCIIDNSNGNCFYLKSFIGTNNDISSSTQITMTGNSLGGHLAGLLSGLIGEKAIVFNAPGYSTSVSKGFNLVEDGHLYTTNYSPYSAFNQLLKNIGQNSSVTHIYNDIYFENNKTWGKQQAISEVSDYTTGKQALDQINNAYYVYNTIKGVINDQNVLDPDNEVDLKTAFDSVYQAYCLSENESLKMLSHDNAMKNKECADEIAIWRQQHIDSNIIVDILPNDYPWSDVINGTEGNDLVFQKRRETASINTDAGNDTVYAIGLDGTNANNAKAYLGAGSDIFYGSSGSDNVDGGYTKDAITDKNIIYLGGGNDIYNGGDGIDIVDGGSGATGEIAATVYDGLKELMTDSADNTNTVKLGGGNDIYIGSVGADNVEVGNGNDIVYTGAGNDYVTANAQSENDTSIIFLGAGSDEVLNNSGESTKIIDGGSGSIYKNLGENAKYFENITSDMQIDSETDVNKIRFNGGNVFYIGTKGQDNVQAKNYYNEMSYAWLGVGNDSYTGDRGIDIVDGGSGNIDVLANVIPDVEINSTVMKDKTSDTNTVSLGDGNDIYYCGAGTDIVYGGSGEDTFYWYADGSFDSIIETTRTKEENTIIFDKGISKDHLIAEYVKDKKINLYTSTDKQEGLSYEGELKYTNIRFADNPNENFVLDQMGLTFDQKDTAETINGTSGDDIIYGNGGDDTINGGKGNDTYVWNLGDGLDTITDTSGESSICFGNGISFSDLSFFQSNRNLIINVKGDDTQGVIIKNYLSSSGSISSLWKNLIITDEQKNYDIPTMDMEINCSQDGSDSIIGGTNGNNIINSGSGNDTIYMGSGSNTFVWNLGDGLDTINFRSLANGENGIIKFGSGITADDLDFYYSSGLKIVVKGDETQGIILKGFTGNGNKDPITTNYDNRLGKIIFDDGSELFLNEIKVHSSNGKGTDFNDIIYNDSATETVFGGAGNDDMIGGELSDRFSGGKGDDHFWGNEGDDNLSGGEGDDTYHWNLGDGLDTIDEYYPDKHGDKIVFGEGITFNDLRFSSSHEQVPGLKITVKDDPTQGIFINGQMDSGKFINPIEDAGIEFLEFADGNIVNLKEIGFNIFSDENTDIHGGKYNDILHAKNGITMYGEAGDDQYVYNLGNGSCKICDADGSNDTLMFGDGITQNHLTFEKDGIHLQINLEDGNNILIENYFNTTSGYQGKIEYLEFANGGRISTDQAVSQLIQAMNSFSISNSASTDTLSNPTENVSDMYSLAASQDLTRKVI